MSGVIIRCPNCGTTQSTIGECDACHEATTRYFCPNHEPGRWLDGPACTVCGARVGVAPRSTTPAAPPRSRTAPPPTPPPAPKRAPPPRVAPDRLRPSVWPRTPLDAPPRRPELEESGSLEEIRPAEPRDDRPVELPFAPIAARAAVVFGCLRRLVLLIVVLLVLALLAFYALFRVGGIMNNSSDAAHASPSTYALAAKHDEAERPRG